MITIYPDLFSAEQEVRTINGIQFAMRYIKPCSFTAHDDSSTYEVSKEVLTGYWMSETVVTQELYESIMGYDNSFYYDSQASGEIQNRRPIENISLLEAMVFCNKLSQLSSKEPVYEVPGISDWSAFPIASIGSIDKITITISSIADGYRILSEYELQWAAIGGEIGGYSLDGYKKYYSGGQVEIFDDIDDYAQYHPISDLKTHEVAKKKPNELGIFDMTGNVWELISNERAMGASAFSNEDFIIKDNLFYQMPFEDS